MYKLIIVDDVTGKHKLLKQYIERVLPNINVVECFADGTDAMKYVNEHPVNIIITDIKMPVVSGLELAKFVYENFKEIRIIIMSAYEDFNYAREAMNYGVVNYLVKPIDMAELKNTLIKITKALDSERTRAELDSEIIFEREEYIMDIVTGICTSEEDMKSKYNELDFKTDFSEVKISVYKLHMKNSGDVLKKHKNHTHDQLTDAISGVVRSVISTYDDADMVMLFNRFEGICFCIVSKNTVEISDVVSNNLAELFELEICMERVCSDMPIQNVFENVKIYDNSDLVELSITYIRTGNKNKAKKILNMLAETDNNIKSMSEQDNTDSMYSKIENKFENEKVISQIKQYIEDNISRGISRDEIAEYVFLNSAYLSRFFKQCTGITLSEYINEVRMKKAIKLLSTNMKFSDIASALGYGSVRQFQRMFKAFSGYSPLDYKKQVLKIKFDE